MDKKIKILYYGDSPSAPTGFGKVSHEIIKRLLKTGKYEIHCLGINFLGDSVPEHKWEDLYLYPIQGDPYGRNRFPQLLFQLQPDVVWCINDYDSVVDFVPRVLMDYKDKTSNPVYFVLYSPIDGEPIYPEWVELLKRYVDKFVVVTKYAQEVIKRTDPTFIVDQVYHGVNLESFKELPEDVIKNIRSNLNDKFVVLAVGVNQLRKQYPILLDAFARFSRDKDDVVLWLHTQPVMSPGWDLRKLIRLFDIKDKTIMTKGIEGLKGVSVDELNIIYNIADVYVSANCGEGFGLPTIEAMACHKPIIIPNNTSNTEVVDGAAHLIQTDHNTIFPNRDRELVRPIPSSIQIVEALEKMYSDKNYRKEMADKAYNKVIERVKNGDFDWDKVAQYFDNEFQKLTNDNSEDLSLEEIL